MAVPLTQKPLPPFSLPGWIPAGLGLLLKTTRGWSDKVTSSAKTRLRVRPPGFTVLHFNHQPPFSTAMSCSKSPRCHQMGTMGRSCTRTMGIERPFPLQALRAFCVTPSKP